MIKNTINSKANYYIESLGLTPHPEGGFFKELYKADENLKADCLPSRYNSRRSFSTSIYFLLEGEQFSSFHRLQSDELWHFYDGCSIKIYIITPDNKLTTKILGRDNDSGEEYQVIIPKLSWFAAELVNAHSYALIGCTVAPGFEFEDFEPGELNKLLLLFPEHSEIIKRLTR